MNVQFYLERLDDPSLLDDAIVVPNGDLAVPVGGKRRGGWVGAVNLRDARSAVQALQGRAGFPNVRIMRGSPTLVAWGEEWPLGDAVSDGDYFGYSSVAIGKFVAEHPHWNDEGRV